jgi:uncharacterized membrane protein YraQ (UPF0718 family)
LYKHYGSLFPEGKEGGKNMDIVLIIVFLVTVVGYGALSLVAPHMALSALQTTANMFVQSLSWIIVSMFAAGLMAEFFHPTSIAKWFGRESGILGILIGALLGLVGTGSRWAVYPLAAGLLAAKASPGAVFSFMTSWQLVSLPRLPAEVPFLGGQYTLLRAGVSFTVSIIGGILMNLITQNQYR